MPNYQDSIYVGADQTGRSGTRLHKKLARRAQLERDLRERAVAGVMRSLYPQPKT